MSISRFFKFEYSGSLPFLFIKEIPTSRHSINQRDTSKLRNYEHLWIISTYQLDW